jgi:FkbM family methyltransferase
MKLVETILPNGYKVSAIEQSKSIIEEIWNSDYYHRHFSIRKGMTVLDVGANLGFYSLYAASKGAKVYSVEPEKRNYSLLLMNIEKNGLQKSVKPFNLAVAKNKKYAYLYYQDFEKDFASGMVSMSKKYLESVTDGEIIKTRVPCASLEQILDMIDDEQIDVMKVDCEGSELDIITSAPKRCFKRIRNIIMETHESYAEKDIFHTVKDLGYAVMAFEKRSGLFHTGYLYAALRDNISSASINRPVAIINSPAAAARKQKILINAAESFPTAHKNNPLIFNWFADNRRLKHNGSAIHVIRFKQAGLHRVGVEVRDQGRTDKAEAAVLVLASDYFKKTECQALNAAAKEYDFKFKGKRNFTIPHRSLPGYWTAQRIVLSLGLLDENEGTWERRNERFIFNGTATTLSGRWKEIKLVGIPPRLDINFTLSFKKEHTVRIIYWAETKKEEIEKKPLYLKEGGKYFLTDIGLEHVCRLKNSHHFIIRNRLLPKEWNQKTIVLAFGIRREDKNTTPLSARITCGNIKATLSGYHNEVKLPFPEHESDIHFRLDTEVKRDIGVKWWLMQ